MESDRSISISLQNIQEELRKQNTNFESQFSGRIKKLEEKINTLQKTISLLQQKKGGVTTTTGGGGGEGEVVSHYNVQITFVFMVLVVAILVGMRGEIIQVYKQVTHVDPVCRNVSFYHWESQIPLHINSNNCSLPLIGFIQLANKAFPRGPVITQLLSSKGEDLPDIINFEVTLEDSSSLMFVALADDEKYIWPAEYLNRTVNRTLGLPYAPHTVGIRAISKEPRLLEVIGLMTPEESDHFFEVAKMLEKEESKVGSDTESAVKSLSRTSSHTWLGRESMGSSDRWYTDATVDRVEKRIFELTRTDTVTAEPFQVVFYQKDQYYYGHHDYSTKTAAPNNPYYQGGGNRLLTVLIYLNDVDQGGETTFPFVDEQGRPINRHIAPTDMYEGAIACTSGGVKVKPKKGGAILFYNLKENGHMDGVVDPWSLHAGCTVTQGEKYITNKWIRNKRVQGKLYDSSW